MTFERQRGSRDCAVAALACFAELPYEDVYVEAAKIDPRARGKMGLYSHEVIRLARRIGIVLKPTRTYDLDDDAGILRVRWNGPRGKAEPGGHFVAIRDGFVLCPSDGFPTRWTAYLEQNHARACTLLRDERA